MRICFMLLIGSLVLLMGFGDAWTQFRRGGGGSRPRRGGGGGGGFDPGQMFDRMANGKPVITLSEITDQRAAGFLNRIAQSAGITNGQITKEQYLNGLQQMRAQWSGGRGVPTKPATADGKGTPTAEPSKDDVARWDQLAEAEFTRRDRNGDKVLNQDEMGKSLRAEWQQWDANRDGVIDLNEFKAYYKSKMQQQNQWQPMATAASVAEDLDKKPTVLRAGKLPKELPAWFKQVDKNGDGQIGLYEWRQAGKPIEDFLAMDRNQDGFLTIEEVLRAEKLNKGAKKATATASTASANPPTGRRPR